MMLRRELSFNQWNLPSSKDDTLIWSSVVPLRQLPSQHTCHRDWLARMKSTPLRSQGGPCSPCWEICFKNETKQQPANQSNDVQFPKEWHMSQGQWHKHATLSCV